MSPQKPLPILIVCFVVFAWRQLTWEYPLYEAALLGNRCWPIQRPEAIVQPAQIGNSRSIIPVLWISQRAKPEFRFPCSLRAGLHQRFTFSMLHHSYLFSEESKPSYPEGIYARSSPWRCEVEGCLFLLVMEILSVPSGLTPPLTVNNGTNHNGVITIIASFALFMVIGSLGIRVYSAYSRRVKQLDDLTFATTVVGVFIVAGTLRCRLLMTWWPRSLPWHRYLPSLLKFTSAGGKQKFWFQAKTCRGWRR